MEGVGVVFFRAEELEVFATAFFFPLEAADFLAVGFLPFGILVAEDFLVTFGDDVLRDTVFLGLDDRRVFFEELLLGMKKTFLLSFGGECPKRHEGKFQHRHNKYCGAHHSFFLSVEQESPYESCLGFYPPI